MIALLTILLGFLSLALIVKTTNEGGPPYAVIGVGVVIAIAGVLMFSYVTGDLILRVIGSVK